MHHAFENALPYKRTFCLRIRYNVLLEAPENLQHAKGAIGIIIYIL